MCQSQLMLALFLSALASFFRSLVPVTELRGFDFISATASPHRAPLRQLPLPAFFETLLDLPQQTGDNLTLSHFPIAFIT